MISLAPPLFREINTRVPTSSCWALRTVGACTVGCVGRVVYGRVSKPPQARGAETRNTYLPTDTLNRCDNYYCFFKLSLVFAFAYNEFGNTVWKQINGFGIFKVRRYGSANWYTFSIKKECFKYNNKQLTLMGCMRAVGRQSVR